MTADELKGLARNAACVRQILALQKRDREALLNRLNEVRDNLTREEAIGMKIAIQIVREMP